jgi:hypothetical protein
MAYLEEDFERSAEIYIFILAFCTNKNARNVCRRNLLVLLDRGIIPALWRVETPQMRFPLTMTTCKRFDLFERTIISFFRFVDYWCVDYIILLDDGSSAQDIARMRALMDEQDVKYEIHQKTIADKGHPQSINQIRAMMLAQSCPFFIHMEDDIEFFFPATLIRMCAEVLMQFPQYGQCLFANSYKEERRDFATLPWGAAHTAESGTVFYEHVWKDPANPHGYWPGFSLRPGLNRVDMWRQMGDVIEGGSFEKDYATRCAAAGWKTAYLEEVTCEHIGRKTSEKFDPDKHNAYTLNGSLQFDNFTYKPKVIERSMVPRDPALNRLFLKDATALSDEVVQTAVAHVRLWMELLDGFKKVQAFQIGGANPNWDAWNQAYFALNGFDPWDILFLSGPCVSIERAPAEEAPALFAASTSYVLHYTGAQKLLQWVKENGLGDGVGAAIQGAKLLAFRGIQPALHETSS